MNALSATLRKPKVQMLLLLLLLAVIGNTSGSAPLAKLSVLAVALAAAVLAEWVFFGAVPSAGLQSAAITGAIIGLLISPSGNLLTAWVAAVLAIASKKIPGFRKGQHIFNPAAFGLAASIPFFGDSLNWWGNSSTVVLVIGAGLLLMRMHRLALPFSYFIVRAATSMMVGTAYGFPDALLAPNLFFAFIMLVEPKTSPGKRAEQWLFGGLCGMVSTLFYRFAPAFEGDLFALLILNFFRPAIPALIGMFKKEATS